MGFVTELGFHDSGLGCQSSGLEHLGFWALAAVSGFSRVFFFGVVTHVRLQRVSVP